jgi:hypothetical protein
MPGLEHEIIVLLGNQLTGYRRSPYSIAYTTRHQMLEIGLPLAKVIIDVQAGNAALFCFMLKPCDVPRHGYGVLDELLAFVKLQIIDYVNQEERDGTFMNYAIIVHRSLIFPPLHTQGFRICY